jgi:hypothetical protein
LPSGADGHVAALEGGDSPRLLDIPSRPCGTLPIDIDGHHLGTLTGKEQRRRTTDPTSGARDDGNLIL